MQTARNLSTSSFKSHIRQYFKLALIIVLSLIIFIFLESVLQNRDSVSNRKREIAALPENSIDIMIIGNSHAFCTFNPDVMERTLDKRVMNLGVPNSEIDVTYYNLKEMLKRQKPELIVLEAFVFGRSNGKYSGYWANVDSFDFGIDKIKACFEIYPDKLEALGMCSRLARCHNNWKHPGIIKENLKNLMGINTTKSDFGKGFYKLSSGMSAATIQKYRDSKDLKFAPVIDDYSIGYFKRIAGLCKEKGIRLVVAMAPMNDIYLNKIDYKGRGIYQKMSFLCKEQGVEYVDFNMLYDDLGLTYDDFEDACHNAQHTNYRGAEKVSSYMAKFLSRYN